MTEMKPQEGYQYSWTPSSKEPLNDFLEKNKPATLRDDAKHSKQYIWVANTDEVKSTIPPEAIEDGKAILKEIATKVAAVQADSEIPIRANKKKGLKSKKEVREEIQAGAKDQLKEVALKHEVVGGKWLAFAGGFQVNTMFAKLAESLVSGELSQTSAYQMRMSTLSAEDPEGAAEQRHNIEVYFPNVYDEETAKEAMRVLLRYHGLKLSGAKADLYTAIGLDSKHASGIPSTVWKGNGGAGSLLTEKEVQDLRSAYYEETGKNATADGTEPTTKKGPIVGKNRAIAKEDNPFDSDEEEDAGATKSVADVKKKAPAKATKAATRKRPATDSEDEGDVKGPPKKAAKFSTGKAATRAPARTKGLAGAKKAADSDSD